MLVFRRDALALVAGLTPIALGIDRRPALVERRRGVVDRVVDGQVVLLVDGERRQVTAPAERLPADARSAGAVVDAILFGDRLLAASVDEAATERRARAAEDRLDDLSVG